jgi:hypothetical protein
VDREKAEQYLEVIKAEKGIENSVTAAASCFSSWLAQTNLENTRS